MNDEDRAFVASIDAWAGLLRLANPDLPERNAMIEAFIAVLDADEGALWQTLLTGAMLTRELIDHAGIAMNVDDYINMITELGEEL